MAGAGAARLAQQGFNPSWMARPRKIWFAETLNAVEK
jgi:hypothetical protein